jgi:hypothetical protein
MAIDRWVKGSKGLGEWLHRKVLSRKMKHNVIVNGDDILFKCEKSFMSYFYEATAEVGLHASVGKNFVSADMCTINSQVFRRIDGKMTRFSYLNQRFIYGKGNYRKSSSDTDVTLPTQLSRGVNEMCNFVPWSRCIVPMVMSRFKQQWFGKSFYGFPNWYLPVHLGGLGFDKNLAPPTLRITTAQRRIAAMFVHNPALALYRLKGVDIPTAKYYGALAKPRMIPGIYVPEAHEEEDLNDHWLARLAYCARAHHGFVKVSDKVFYTKFKRDFRLRPMSLQKLIFYENIRWFQTKLPICPALNILN